MYIKGVIFKYFLRKSREDPLMQSSYGIRFQFSLRKDPKNTIEKNAVYNKGVLCNRERPIIIFREYVNLKYVNPLHILFSFTEKIFIQFFFDIIRNFSGNRADSGICKASGK